MSPVVTAEITVFVILVIKQKYDTRLFLVLTCSPSWKTLLHGKEISSGPYTVGKQARYVCNPGYILVGSSVRNCINKNSSAVWNEEFPLCLTHFQFKKFCNGLLLEVVLRDGEYSCGKFGFCFCYYSYNSSIKFIQFLKF